MRNLLIVFVLLFASAAQAAGMPSDSELVRRVRGTLSAALGAPARNIEVVALDGAVWLHGRIATQAAREAAASAAERTPGVRVVSNLLIVRGGR